ncbi:Disease resistance RPP13-like protein 4 [Forsythia ovata]|uniref:Disease resistance RPP13-like protein 4 n=1 Tax=Forsythia ovata TaxID=205694 RepID=A0ABD1Q0R9_9LAMI
MADIYSEFLLDKFVNEFQEAEKVWPNLPLLNNFKEIFNILQEKKFKPQKLIDLKDDLHEINDALVEHIGLAEDRRGNGKASATRTGKDLWIRYKTRRRLRSIRDKLQKIAPADLLADEEDTITSEVLVIKKDNLINIDLSEYHGLDDQKVKIENLLCESVGNKAIGIVGMGGSGKSALARKVIFSSRVEHLFELILWIDLSKAMGSEKKYQCISVTKDDVEKINCELNLGGLLTETFLEPQKKCLVVLDGVWHAIDGFNTLIEGILDGPIKGSVIVTSRLPQVVKKLLPEEKNYFYLHTMQPLSRDDCWCIFEDSIERKNFISSKVEILLEMKDEILDNCEGLPLAVKTLAEIISIQICKQG